MSEKKLTKEQQLAVEFENNILLPANAGSGKTSVMLERVIFAITKKKLNVQDFLLITFTDAAASQMRTKLQKELLKAYSNETDKEIKSHIKNQINFLPLADISTIDSFCYQLVKKYFYTLGIESNINICEDSIAKNLKEKAFEKTLSSFCVGENQAFLSLISDYDNKRNFSSIKKIVLKLEENFESVPDKDALRQKILDVYKSDTNKIFEVMKDWVLTCFDYYKQAFNKLLAESRFLGAGKIEDVCQNVLTFLNKFSKETSFEEIHKNLFNSDFINMKNEKVPEQQELYEEVKNLKTEFSKSLKNLKDRFLFNDFQKLKDDIFWCENNVKMLLEMEKSFEETFQTLKKQKNVLDFSDIENFALKILRDSKLAKEISSSYKQIFVDEYQDVNDIQEELVTLLWKSGKNVLFLVGDPKQSIYGFRHTNPQIMLNKLKTFTPESDETKSIPLFYNFRSNKNILEFSNFVFSKLMTEKNSKLNYEKDGKFLVGLEDFPEESKIPYVEIDIINSSKDKEETISPTDIYSVKNAETFSPDNLLLAKAEARVVSEKIKQLLNKNYKIFDPDTKENGGMRALTYSDIAILYRSRAPYVDALLSEIENMGVPIKKVSRDKVFDEYEVQVLINFLKLLNNADDDFVLTGFLMSPVVDMDIEELSKIPIQEEKSFAKSVLESNNEKVLYAKSLIEEGRNQILNNTIFYVLNWFLEKTDYRTKLLKLPNGQSRILNVNVFVNDLQTKIYNSDIVSFLSFLEQNDEIKVETENGGDADAVKVMTMHKSKGLEFPVVFVVNMSHQFNQFDSSGPCIISENLGIGVERFDKEKRFKTETLARSAIKIDLKKKTYAEELRLLYVALTRAKNHLFLIGTSKLDKLEEATCDFLLYKKLSPFDQILGTLGQSNLNSLMAGGQYLRICTDKEKETYFDVKVCEIEEKVQNTTETNNQYDEFLQYTHNIMKNISKNQEILARQREESNVALKNSVSRIMEKEEGKENVSHTFKKFEISEDSPSPDKVGTAFHSAMEIVPFDLKSEEEVRKFLENHMEHEEFLMIDTKKIFKCIQNLQPFLKGAKKVLREQKFYLYESHNKIVPNGVNNKILIQGIVDLIICFADEAILLDYKTNHEKNDQNLIKKYQIQLDCYKIAIENALKIKVSRKILYSFFKDYAIFV